MVAMETYITSAFWPVFITFELTEKTQLSILRVFLTYLQLSKLVATTLLLKSIMIALASALLQPHHFIE